jgi:hypothetical protein
MRKCLKYKLLTHKYFKKEFKPFKNIQSFLLKSPSQNFNPLKSLTYRLSEESDILV